MKKMSTHEKERHYFEMFRKDYLLPPGTIIYYDKPDVILEGERKIGIEITNFYLEKGELLESEQRQRDLRDAIISDAQRMYEARNKKKIEVTIEFDKANPIRGTRDVVQKLVALAEQIKEYKTGQIGSHIFQNIPEVSYVYLCAEECATPKWRSVQVYSGSIMSRDNLIRIVRDKEESSQQYKKCDSFWLLIVVDFMDRAQDQEIQIDGFGKVESDVFEKIIVYKTTFPHVLEAK
ncbi:MAG: hypothetical protein QME44_05530 [Thermodesulfobacteriota bacterium]|nr:hypothetical protein [Thermodesulfobacteriota bacterium]